jgi:hypothetical protein
MSRPAIGEIAENCGSGRNQDNELTKRGRVSAEEWQLRARYVLRHLSDPIALQRSPLCRLQALERLAEANYPTGVVARGRSLNELALECLEEIENELHGYAGAAKLKSFIALTRQGMKAVEASRILDITPEYASRKFKRTLVDLLAEKLVMKLH